MKTSSLIRLVLAAALPLQGCASLTPKPSVVVGETPSARGTIKVAVLPFDDKTDAKEDVGAIAAKMFQQELLRFRDYEVRSEVVDERTLKVKTTVDSGSGDSESVEYTATEKTIDPVSWGKKKGVDAVVTGTVTRYRHPKFFILPPAAVGLEVRLIDVKTRRVIWSATDQRAYNWKWLASIIPVVAMVLAVTSPSADTKLKESIVKTAKALRKELKDANRNLPAGAGDAR